MTRADDAEDERAEEKEVRVVCRWCVEVEKTKSKPLYARKFQDTVTMRNPRGDIKAKRKGGPNEVPVVG